MSTISIASYNVHRCIGTDGLQTPERIIKVLKELNADIIGLQEACFPSECGSGFSADDLAKAMNMELISGRTLCSRNGHFGNVLLTSYPIIRIRRVDLSVRYREPRGALDVDLDIHGIPVRTIITHLGLRAFERHVQVEILLNSLSVGHAKATILLGDFNLWSPISVAQQHLTNQFGYGPRLKTYPSRFPLFPLDRIWVHPKSSLVKMNVHRSPFARVASDHLPIKAVIDFGKI